MQLNKIKLNTIPPLNPNPYPLTPLNISFLCAFAPLRDKIRANSCLLVVQPSPFQGEPALSRNLFLRNKPNFNNTNITATSYRLVAYNTFFQKTKNGANPNKPNQSQFQSLQFLRQKIREYLAKIKKMKSKANFQIKNPAPNRFFVPPCSWLGRIERRVCPLIDFSNVVFIM